MSGIEEESSDWVSGVGVELGLVSWQGLALGLTPEEERVEVVGLTESWVIPRHEPLGTGFWAIKGTGGDFGGGTALLKILGLMTGLLALLEHFALYVQWFSAPQCRHLGFLPGNITNEC